MKAIIFDLGRVLLRWDPDAVVRALSQISRATASELQALLQARHAELNTGRMSAQDLHRYLMQHAGTTGNWDRFYEAACHGLGRDEEALAYVRSLARRPGLRLGVISNTNAIHSLWIRQHVPELRLMSSVLLSPDVGLMKPDPAIYRLALEQLEIGPTEALFVDDLPRNVKAAQALGLAGIVHRDWPTTRARIESWLTT